MFAELMEGEPLGATFEQPAYLAALDEQHAYLAALDEQVPQMRLPYQGLNASPQALCHT